jgi:L-alanine-DL-glutamate epimerase-like enolase superfamily enzyme
MLGEPLKITRVSTAVVHGNFDWVLIQIETDAGITGLGEAHWGAGVRDAVHFLRPYLIGEDARDVDRIWRKLYHVTSGAPWSGSVLCAANGIEMALLDAMGKLLGTPVYQLLGGRHRDRVRIYADCHAGKGDVDGEDGPEARGPRSASWHASYDPNADYRADAYAARARSALESGFTAIKFDLDVPTSLQHDPYNRVISAAHLEYMVELVASVRTEVGPDIDLAFDCHWSYNVGDAIRLARALEPYRLWWLEDPLPPENVEALARVCQATATPICTGENLYLRDPFLRLLAAGGADIIEPDLPRSAGMLEFKRICDLADQYYVPVAPHNVCSPVGTIAAVHMGAAVTNFLAVEFHAIDVDWWSEMVRGDAAKIDSGYLPVPPGPGLGIELNEDLVRGHLVPGTGFFDD